MSNQQRYDTIIVGGGLSGLSAAVELASRGQRVLLTEQKYHPGGRTNSFTDDATGDVVDNGQHLMMGCYHATRSYLRAIGTDHLATLQQSLCIDFVDPLKGPCRLQASSLPPPFHVLSGLLGLTSISRFNRMRLLRVGKELLWTSNTKERLLDSMTVDEWLSSLGQPEENKKYLWDTIAIGSLNDHPARVSALLFFRVLRAAFMGTREDSCLLVPNVGLSALFVEPAVRFITEHGGKVRTGTRIQSIVPENGHLSGIRTASGEILSANATILAIPFFDLAPLLSDDMLVPSIPLFVSTPIVSINLWFDREIFDGEFAAVLNSNIQWIFNRSRICRPPGGRRAAGQHLSLVISGAETIIDWTKEFIVQTALADVKRVLPRADEATLVHSLVIKERRATFSPRPGMEALRPGTRTAVDNLFLAGDWTATGLPATIEGAVLSGKKAAEAVLSI